MNNKKFKVIKKASTGYGVGYSKSNCLAQGINPDLPLISASPLVEKAFKGNQEIGMVIYAYQDSIDKHGKSWEHQPIRIKVTGLQHGFGLGDKIVFENLECVRIVTHSGNGNTTANYYYKATAVRLLKEGDNNA
ncbi:hypothetical protein [Ligilactobacillus aviarius]|uniref:Uncharacterized protein n=1 Tax=Ligilactobacillus aviarius TaxID=1606 RepID=A0A510WPU1_9LACO|nr:hypothetical protein [Ligilactobacillus aviarius]KRM38187.1 hypothetical protein FC33_GL000263 [Ligilactobacillus aviarius subsp. aviarius DSM 20655]GEK41176.1 hypothetical protein LAV01_00080 [Ligilactobacillus aviarius]